MYEIDRDSYIEQYSKVLFDKYGVLAGDVWDIYHSRVEFALDLIPRFRIGKDNATEKYLRIGLGVDQKSWRAMKETFVRLQEALESDKVFNKLKSEIALLKGIEASEYKNAKMIEMLLKLYNDDYQKSDEQKIELPETISITIENKQKSNEELDEYAPDIKEE